MTSEATAVVYDDFIADDDTGEVYEWPKGVATADRISWLIAQANIAADETKHWDDRRGVLRRVIGRMLNEAGFKGIKTASGNATNVAGSHRRKTEATDVQAAVEQEMLTQDEAIAILIAAAKTLDVDAVEQFITNMPQGKNEAAEDHEKRRKVLRALLIRTSVGNGYTRVSEPTHIAPRSRKESR